MPNISKILHLLAYGIYLAFTTVARLLPLKLVFVAGRGLGTLGSVIFSNRRRVAEENLMLALGMTREEAAAMARKHFATLGANMLSAIKIATMSDDEIRACVTVEIPSDMEEALKTPGEKKGWVAMISHMGNWEIFSHLSPLFPYYKYGAVYHKLANDYVDRHFKETRAVSGVTLFDRREGYLKCVAFLRSGGAVGVLVDQYAGLPGTWMPFFNRLTSTSTLAATLAQRAGVEIIPISINTTGVARWHVKVSRALENDENTEILTARINRELEKQIAASPADWLWSHNRWKTPRWVFLFTRSGRRIFYPPGFDRAALIPYRIVIRAVDDLEEAGLSLPAVRAIKNGRPDVHLTIVTAAALAELWKAVREVDEVVAVEPGEPAAGVGDKIKSLGRFDAGVIFSPERRAAEEIKAGGVPYRIGPPHRFLLNDWKNSPGLADPPLRGAERYRRIAEGIGAEME